MEVEATQDKGDVFYTIEFDISNDHGLSFETAIFLSFESENRRNKVAKALSALLLSSYQDCTFIKMIKHDFPVILTGTCYHCAYFSFANETLKDNMQKFLYDILTEEEYNSNYHQGVIIPFMQRTDGTNFEIFTLLNESLQENVITLESLTKVTRKKRTLEFVE